MRQSTIPSLLLLIFSLLAALNTAIADTSSALLAMEDPQNPLIRISTSQGEIYLELFPLEAPSNVENFIALAEAEKEFTNPDTGELIQARYYNGMRFHRVVPGFVIQAGSPVYNPLGVQVTLLNDEINADALGLDQISGTQSRRQLRRRPQHRVEIETFHDRYPARLSTPEAKYRGRMPGGIDPGNIRHSERASQSNG